MSWILDDTTRKARKRHLCSACQQYIEPGTEYRNAAMADTGDFWVWKAHPECDRIYEAWSRYLGEWESVESWDDVLDWWNNR